MAEKTEPSKEDSTVVSTATADVPKTTTVPAVAPKPVTPVDHHRRTRTLEVLLVAIIVAAIGFGGGWLGAASHNGTTEDITQQKTVLSSQAAVVSSIAKQVGQSVVSVNVTGQTATTTNPYASLFGYGGGSGSQTQQSAGTGIILNSSGLIMTNRHVVPTGTTSVSVTLSDGTVLDNVKVVGRTSDSDTLDVAFLQVQDKKGKTLVPAKLGNSSNVKVGDPVVAIGNALGQFQNTVTSGIISGYGRSVQASDSDGTSAENLDNLFQTDAAINEGNSGGPLVNLNGEVIGMNTAIASDSQSIGFAIPINDISGLIDSVKLTGKVERPYLGVVYVAITSDIAKEYSLSREQGAYIPTTEQLGKETIVAGSPAEKAGLKQGDIITKIDGTAINQTTSITAILGKHKVGDKVALIVVRDGKTITINATLGAAPTS